MAWYKTGSVSITSGQTTVTGIGTNFASNVRVGDGFKGPNGLWYEIVNIASQTVLGIFPAYAGPTVTANTNYMVAPLQGYNKESADRLRAITDSFPTALDGKQDKSQNLTSFSSLVGSTDRLPYFTGVGALSLATLTSKAREFLSYTTEANMLNWMSGENTNPLGGTGTTDLNTLRTKRTDYYIVNGVNTPTGGNGYLTVIPLAGTTECYQRYTIVNGSGSYERTQLSGNWSTWTQILRAGDFGIGSQNVPQITDFAGDIKPGFYYSYGAAHASAPANGPVGSGGGAVGIVAMQGINNANYKSFLGVSQSGGPGTLFVGSKVVAGAPVWNRVITQESAILDPALATGGLIFYGSNANGEFWKFANGLLICKGKITTLSAAANSNYTAFGTYPHPFLAGSQPTPAGLSRAAVSTDNYGIIGGDPSNTNAANGAVFIIRNGATPQIFEIWYTSIGRWK